MKKRENNNKGFSLVELIVVIAIMIVLVAVLAPVFTRYVERSRRATDIQNANTISEAILIEVADNGTATTAEDGVVADTAVELNDTNVAGIESIQSAPTVAGNYSNNGGYFWYEYDSDENLVYVYINNAVSKDNDLTNTTYSTIYGDTTQDETSKLSKTGSN